MVFRKLARAVRIVVFNGGIKASLRKIFFMDTLKMGELMGTDAYGNTYYQSNYYFFGSNRWVEYNPKCGLHYDASQIPPEWFGWLHHRTDKLPHEESFRPNYKWMLPHEPNLTGTPCQYYPYDTTLPKIIPWKPPRKENLSQQSDKCK